MSRFAEFRLAPVFLFLVLLAPTATLSADPGTGPPPGWITPVSAPLELTRPTEDLFGGFHYLLHDQQYDVSRTEYFSHHVYRVVTREGVADMSDVQVDFDPSYQDLTFHSLRIHRDGRVIDQLANHPIRTFQREEGMEANLYDGSVTAVINQENVRIGDVIEYSFTIQGTNPAFGDRFFLTESLDYLIPVERKHLRILIEPDREIHLGRTNGAPEPEKTHKEGAVEWTWNLENVDPVVLEDNLPPWFDPFASVTLTDFPDWSSVVAWALPHYRIGESDRTALKAAVADIAGSGDEEKQVLRVIRFVQDEIRYLGMEQGLGAFVPQAPGRVLDQRFGDCKDKSLLLAGLLRELGVPAHAVLVNYAYGRNLEEKLPTPYAFDHCIVSFTFDGDLHFVDPTFYNQGGDLARLKCPAYIRGLVLAEGQEGLTAIPRPSSPTQEILYHFAMEELGGPVSMTVTTTMEGFAADNRRGSQKTISADNLELSYLDYYSQVFDGIHLDGPIEVQDEGRDSDNRIVVIESYVIDNFWQYADTDSTILMVELFPLEMVEYLDLPASSRRTMPYYLGPPSRVKSILRVDLPMDWPVEGDPVSIDGDGYSYRSELSSKGKQVKAVYEYERTLESASPQDTPRILAEHDVMFDDLTFFLTHDPTYEEFRFSWPMGLIFLVSLVIASIAGVLVHRRYDPPPRVSVQEPLGFGGWLILPAIGVILGPIRDIASLVMEPYIFDANTLAASIETNPQWGMEGEFLLNGMALFLTAIAHVISVLLLVQFYRKRTSLPRLVVIGNIYGIMVMIYTLVTTFIGAEFEGLEQYRLELLRDIVISMITASIWIPYFLVSRRVKMTFVRRSKTQPPRPVSLEEGEDPDGPPAPVQPAPVADTSRFSRPARWPASMVWLGILNILTALVVAFSQLIQLGRNGGVVDGLAAPNMTGRMIAFLFLIAPPLIGAFGVFGRRAWARRYNMISLSALVILVIVMIFATGVYRGDPEAILGFLGIGIIMAPFLITVIILAVSKAARTFPLELKGPGAGTGEGPAGDELCHMIVLGRLRSLKDRFPNLDMEMTENETSHDAALVIPEQEGIPRSLVIEMKNGRDLNLHVGPAHFTWSPCDKLKARERFFLIAGGLLEGQWRLVEFLEQDEVVALYLQERDKRGWTNRYMWNARGHGSVKGLDQRVVEF